MGVISGLILTGAINEMETNISMIIGIPKGNVDINFSY